MRLTLSAKEELLKSLRRSAHEELVAIAHYEKRASYAAKHDVSVLSTYKRIIKDEREHYRSFMIQITRIKQLR
jgi:rubrerythrin